MYYLNREKLRLVGREQIIEEVNRKALQIAKDVAKKYDCLVAGNICNTDLAPPNVEDWTPELHREIRGMFEEQVNWAAEEGVDYIIGETFGHLKEALIALEVIKRSGLPAVITMTCQRDGKCFDGFDVEEAFMQLEANGATVVGFNCGRGPWSMLPELQRVLKVVKIPVAALPVPYRTTEMEPTFFSISDPRCPVKVVNDRPFPVALDPLQCNRFEIAEFTKRAQQLGVRYFGLCCGAGPHHVRSMAEALGRTPIASKNSVDMSKHFAFGSDKTLKSYNTESSHLL